MKVTRRKFLFGLCAAWATRLELPLHAAEVPGHVELKNEFFQLRLRAKAGELWLDQLLLNQEPSATGAGFTPNLLASDPEKIPLHSSTAILQEGMGWLTARLKFPAKITRGHSKRRGEWLRVDDIWLGPEAEPVVRETWLLELRANQLRWKIARNFLRDARLIADRFPALLLRTFILGPQHPRAQRWHGAAQVPGFLDPDMQLDGQHAFPLQHPDREWFEVISPKRDQEIHLAPSGLSLESKLSTGWFGYAKPASDGTVQIVAIGAETVDRSRGIMSRRAGSQHKQTWTLKLKPNDGVAAFRLALPDTTLAELARSFAAVHNQWKGWMFGNNPASVPILHEMAWYPMIQSIYATSRKVQHAMRKQLLFFAENGVESNGYVYPRWSMSGYYRVHWGNLHDQIPHFILAMYFHALNTGDRDFLRRVMPALDRVAHYMTSLDRDGDGVMEVPNTSGLPNGERDCSNWYDIIKFGHKDAYINVYCCMALKAMSEMKAYVSAATEVEEYFLRSRQWADGFNRVFWDPVQGFYMDWVDAREKMPESGRRYFYTDHNLLAIVFGIATPAQAARILANLDRRYDELCREFRLPREAIYATPCNMNPITQMGDMVQFGELNNQKVFPNYENGCSFFHTTGFEIAARGLAGQPEAAYETFARVMRQGYARNRFWAAALKWDTDRLVSEPLNNALLILWGVVQGCFGLRPTLDGLNVVGRPPKAMEGSHYTFCHLGKNVRVSVRNGETKIL